MKKILAVLLISSLLYSCGSQKSTKLRLVSPQKSGITFANHIVEDDVYNILKFSYLYNGGGVSIGDFDNNGLPDIFFTGNMVDNALYLNQGDMKFKDVTGVAGVASPKKWIYGSATVDINGDGWLDIYACASMAGEPEMRKNMLFVNQGLNEDGIPTFEDEAAAYGIDDDSYSSQASFFDYDRDNDLDLFILSNTKVEGIPSVYRPKITDGSSNITDRFYRNNGDGTFTNISDSAGILIEGFGLGVAVLDVNKDGQADIYVGNDYITNDILYVNEGGKFTDKIDDMMQHQGRFSMGNDAADINNDGHVDIMTLDMLPESNLRKKTVMMANGYIVYINDNRYGYTHQYVRNMLQLNNGNMSFSEVGQLAGVHQTEWSWSPLFADIDNDGMKDLLITNGFPKDITDNDFINFRKKAGAFVSIEDMLKEVPSVKIPNYVFRNEGDLGFKNVSEEWGFTQPSFSNGAAFADFDLDGDLDYVVNNINDPAFLYENTSSNAKKSPNHYLRIKLKGPKLNSSALGAKVTLFGPDGNIQYHEHNIYRGYVSTVEDVVHFGLGDLTAVNKVQVVWPDGKLTILENVPADQVLEMKYEDAKEGTPVDPLGAGARPKLVESYNEVTGIDLVHEERDFIDYNVQRNIPHKFSQSGPALARGDINGDQLTDLIVGGPYRGKAKVLIQDSKGTFSVQDLEAGDVQSHEDMGMLLFDADGDGDLDLYRVSGGFELPEGSERMQDKLMLNDGKGKFSYANDALPEIRASGSCVKAADFDQDGDLDLFIGGRVVIGEYPKAPRSYLLRNDEGKFSDVTDEMAPGLAKIGMVTQATWSDYNKDGSQDLIVVGEFLPISIFANKNGKLELQENTGIDGLAGWWNRIEAGDFDGDGDMDFIAGNLGKNNFFCAEPDQPVRVTANDFDSNGRMDVVMSCYFKAEDGTMKPFPVHSWEELNVQSPFFRNRFDRFSEYAVTTIDELFTEEDLKGAVVLEANQMATSYIENLGNGKFAMKALPVEAQFAPVNGISVLDINKDGNLDVAMVGNDFGNEVNIGQHDAFTGLVLLGDGKGGFEPVVSRESGFFVNGDAKDLVNFTDAKGNELLVASQNRGPLKVFRVRRENQ